MKKAMLLFWSMIFGFCVGFFLCYLVVNHETEIPSAKAEVIVLYSRKSGSFDPYTSNVLFIKSRVSFEKKELAYRLDSVVNLLPESEFKPKLTLLSSDSINFKVLCCPNNGVFPNFFENSYLLTKDSIYQLHFKSVEILTDTLIEISPG